VSIAKKKLEESLGERRNIIEIIRFVSREKNGEFSKKPKGR